MSSRLSRISIMFLVAILVAGCETINPYTGETQTSKATKGALIGAAAGAVVGLVSGDNAVERRQHALIGAGIGALAGGGIGYYMDVQEAKLRQKLEGTGVSVTRIGDNITLNMPGNITFETASSNLNGDFYRVLDGVSEVVNEYDQTVIEVAGHTDSRGSAEYNLGLSDRRADEVGTYLESRGVMRLRIITVGLGEDMPVADNSTSRGQLLNRRVELTLVPVTG
ncbi:MAG: OmpA family protein [Gammaproteobacteria bacterium]|nr:OmpA family protein [Pseudomonadota bacterium]MCZ6500871.1 OmpA family protein [Gammaproteobacteria bacterium]MCZ6715994.1 OmpA family protein [Gammaproteobacteria bacterium]MCZ6827653.1 OmpA family protein [Gammaproteobacteria bacterium]MCZ6912179.1 OmpA family protein [Pseudomonadota bacterium]